MGGEDWVRGRLLGSGSFGKVYIAIDRSTGQQFAVKSAGGEECSSPRRNAQDLEALENETMILQRMECPQVRTEPADDSGMLARNLHRPLAGIASIYPVC